jgi:DNA-binding HxlR family transcriptional regulator
VDTISGEWAVVILGHLNEQPLRYSALRRRVPSITEKMLTQRLRKLEAPDWSSARCTREYPAR